MKNLKTILGQERKRERLEREMRRLESMTDVEGQSLSIRQRTIFPVVHEEF
jgi:hypothetical protein